MRLWEPHIVYSATIRTNDRQFLLKPNHDPQHPLLAAGCPSQALDTRNNLIPVPSVIDIVGSAFARALHQHPVQLHWLEANINHLHVGVSAAPEQIENLSPFFQHAHSLVARNLNQTWKREGHLWSARVRTTSCVDDVSAVQQAVYALTNPVKDDLVERVSESPFFTTFRALARGEEALYWYMDWNAYNLAGGSENKKHRAKDYLRWLPLTLTPLPEQADWPVHKRRTWIRRQVAAIENEHAEERRAEDRTVMGVPALFRVDPRDRPKHPKDAGPQPLCHAATAEARRAFKRRWREFEREHKRASIDYLAGDHEREFPEGSHRPPITKVYLSSRLRKQDLSDL